MALSLCVGLLIDDAIVVRENIVRHVQMGKAPLPGRARRHAGDRPGGAGDHLLHRRGVPADRLHGRHHRQVLPRVRRHHRGGGADLDVRQLHARPDAVVDLARPASRRRTASAGATQPLRPHHRPRHRLVRPRHRMAGATPTRRILRWSLRAQARHAAAGASRIFVASIFMVPLLGTEFVPKADFSETSVNFYTPVGSSLEVTEAKARQVEAIAARIPRGALHADDHQHRRRRRARSTRRVYVRLVDRKAAHAQRRRDVAACCASGCTQVPGITVTHVGLLDARGRQQAGRVLAAGPRPEGAGAAVAAGDRAASATIPGLVDLDSSVKPDKPTIAIEREARRRRPTSASSWRRSAARCARWSPARRSATGARPTTRTTTSTCASRPTRATRRSDLERLPFARRHATPTAAPRIVRLNQVAERARRRPGRTRSTGAT